MHDGYSLRHTYATLALLNDGMDVHTMATRKTDRPLQRIIESARPVSFATLATYTTSRDTTFMFVS
ncbi:hypothetical protein [Novosphingobium sp. AAP83]|uniref:hypothetical protein n=1 Tax=Novosphingobium sp. AAP83 TaxID=1523425 RepID=UPI0012F902D7|nr:hypothetical protein [Novosphingobium sp. AAP83]